LERIVAPLLPVRLTAVNRIVITHCAMWRATLDGYQARRGGGVNNASQRAASAVTIGGET
jgi:hypothetical protein